MSTGEIVDVILASSVVSTIITVFGTILGKIFIENRFTRALEEYRSKQQQELEEHKHRINTRFNVITKIYERESEILPGLWEKLLTAHGNLVHLIQPFGPDPVLSQMTEQQFVEFQDRYETIWKSFQDFHNYFLYSSIFLGTDIHAEFQTADKIFEECLTKIRVAKQGLEREKLTMEVYINLYENMKPIQERIKGLIRKRLHHSEAE